MDAMRIDRTTGGLATVVLDAPGKPVNTLHPAVLDEFEAVVATLLADAGVRAIVVASAKPDGFIAGADLKLLDTFGTAEAAEAFSRRGNALLHRVATASKPVVAAVHGAALGGGLEVALACRAIVASDDPATVLALPEVTLGLLPGGGGTQRLPRRIGLPAALDLMLTGRRVRARAAYRLGLVDAVTTPGGIAAAAGRLALGLADGQAPRRAAWPLFARLAFRQPLRAVILGRARTQVLRRTHGLYPAPLEILACVRVGLARGVAAGLGEESRRFGRLVASEQSRRLVWLFNASQEIRKPAPPGAARPVHRLGVLGAGFMGTGIAAVSISRWPVVVRDVAEPALEQAARTVRAGLARQVRSGSLRDDGARRAFSRLLLATAASELAHADLVVEAVFEDLALKRRVLAETEAVIAPEAVFASNTSALPIKAIAAEARRPERVLGMHYFSPVPTMPLLEIVAADATAPWAVETARDVGLAQGKTVVVVRDGPGFFTTRILAPYLNEAMLLLEEGARIEDVDRALRGFGFPVGPVALLDEVGIDVGAHVAEELGRAFAARGAHGSRALAALVAAGFRGRKNGRGFYVYPARGRKRANPAVYELLGGASRRRVAGVEAAERTTLAMVNEALHCLAEGVVGSPRDADLAAVLGLGFPPFRGGPFHYVDSLGAGRLLARLEALAERHGPRFAPAPLLADMARQGRAFHPR